MKKSRATGLIKIIRVPDGEAPWVLRRAWVGLTLPCHPFLGPPDAGLDRGVLSGKEVNQNRDGFSVPQNLAIAILGKNMSRAKAWWKKLGYPKRGECFFFAEDEVEVISGVIRKVIVQVSEEMMGDPER